MRRAFFIFITLIAGLAPFASAQEHGQVGVYADYLRGVESRSRGSSRKSTLELPLLNAILGYTGLLRPLEGRRHGHPHPSARRRSIRKAAIIHS